MAFAADLDVLKVKFTHSNTVRDKKPYTIYEIEVRSSSTITWVIYKRYSSFHQLHVDLLNKAPGLTPEQKANLPPLPPKRLTRSLAVEFVEKRKNELQDYLRALLETPGLVHSPVILSFLEVPDSVRPMLAAAQHHQQQHGMGGAGGSHMGAGGFGADGGAGAYLDGPGGSMAGAGAGGGAGSKVSYASKSPDERRILELLNLLRFHPNKVAALKSFEDWFFETRPRLAADYVRMLLQGRSGQDTDGGLIQTIGDLSYSHVASRAALYLLCRLLDVEKNKDAALFLDQFVSFPVDILKKMQINQHIISERGNRIGAFKIIAILRQHLPPMTSGYAIFASGQQTPQGQGQGGQGGPGQAGSTGAGGAASTMAGQQHPQSRDLQLEAIVNDSWALREFYKWAERKSEGNGQIVPFAHNHGAGGGGGGRGLYGFGGGSRAAQRDDPHALKPLDLTSATAAAAAASPSGVAPSTAAHPPKIDVSAPNSPSDGAGVGDVAQMRFLRARISDMFADMKRLLEEKEVFVNGDSTPAALRAGANAAGGADPSAGAPAPWRLVSVVPQFDVHGRAMSLSLFGANGDGTGGLLDGMVPGLGGNGLPVGAGFDDDVSLMYRKSSKPLDLSTVKMSCLLPYALEEVAPYLADLRRRKEWDLKFHKGKLIETRQTQEYAANTPTHGQHPPPSLQYPEVQADIVQMVFKSFSSPYKYRDVVLLRAYAAVNKTRGEFDAQGFKNRQTLAGAGGAAPPAVPLSPSGTGGDESPDGSARNGAGEAEDPIFAGEGGFFHDGGMLFGARSVLHAAGPELKDNVRAIIHPTGYALIPLRDQPILVHGLNGSAQVVSDPGCACLLVFLAQLDRESVLIVSPDLLGETNELRHTFINLKACLARDMGLRTLQPSRHTAAMRAVSGRPDAATTATTAGVGAAHAGHARAASILAQQQPVPITYGQRHVEEDDGAGSRNNSVVASSPYLQPQRGSVNGVPSPQSRAAPGSNALPVIPEKR